MVVRELLTVLGFKSDTSGGEKFNKVLSGTVKLMAATTAAAGLVGAAVLKSAGDFEQAEIALETMTGSAQVAGDLLKEITDFAAKTPFKLTGLIDSSKQLLAFGFEADEIVDKMETLGNISAGVGRDKLPSLILAFGKIRTKGKATMEELNILLEAGVPILDELAKQYGVTTQELTKMVSKGEVGFDNVDKALLGLGTGSGRFAGLMEKQSRSFLGILSNIGDFVDRLKISIGKELLPDAKRIAMEFLNWAKENEKLIKGGIVKFLKVVALGVALLFVGFRRLFAFFPKLIKRFGGFSGILESIVKTFNKLKPILIVVGAALAGYLATVGAIQIAMAAWAAIQGVVNGLLALNPVGIWIAAILALIAVVFLLVKNWETIWDKMKEIAFRVGGSIKDFFTGIFDTIFQAIVKFNTAVLGVLNGFVSLAGNLISNLAQTIFNLIIAPVRLLINSLGKLGVNIPQIPDIGSFLGGNGGNNVSQNNNTKVEVTLPPGTPTSDAQAIGDAVSSAIDAKMNGMFREGITNLPRGERGLAF